MKRKHYLIILLAALVLFLLFELIFRSEALYNSLGSAFYRHKKYNTAAQVFDKKSKNTLKGNKAKALYQDGHYEEAEAEYNEAGANLDYDAGNAAFKQEEWAKARDKYIDALLQDPTDEDAKANLELVLKYLQQQPQPQQQEQDEESKRNEDEVRNILEALDQSERQNRKQQQPQGNGKTDNWW